MLVRLPHLERWKARRSQSVSAWSGVFCASCRCSVVAPSLGCWRKPDRWCRSGWGRDHRSLVLRRSVHPTSSLEQRVEVWLGQKPGTHTLINTHTCTRSENNLTIRTKKIDRTRTRCLYSEAFSESNILGVNFALVMRLSHHWRGKAHVAHFAGFVFVPFILQHFATLRETRQGMQIKRKKNNKQPHTIGNFNSATSFKLLFESHIKDSFKTNDPSLLCCSCPEYGAAWYLP